MFGLFKKDPLVNLQKSYNQLLEEAMQLQRKGDIKGYAAKMAESEIVMNEIEKKILQHLLPLIQFSKMRALEFAQDLTRLDITPSGKMAIFSKINKKALDKISQRRGI